MKELINYAVALMMQENYEPENNPSQNPELNPSQNPDINISQNPDINISQNPNLNPSQNPKWKSAWWSTFKEIILWEYLNDSQKKRCQSYLKQL